MKRSVALAAAVASFILPAAVVGHPHTAHNGQVLANGQNHAPFTLVAGEDDTDPVFRIESCGGDPAAYGLETAHHGRDLEPGRGDGCYETWGVRSGVYPASPQYVPADSSGFQPNN